MAQRYLLGLATAPNVSFFDSEGFPFKQGKVIVGKNCHSFPLTLYGSEVPPGPRGRGRTAGSGMWTRTRESASWSPCGDSAIPYG